MDRTQQQKEPAGAEKSRENIKPIRCRITVSGTVQGVGFRPFIYGLANSLQLTGNVYNSGDAVCIEAEGSLSRIAQFLIEIKNDAPPLARVDIISCETLTPAGYSTFCIKKSSGKANRRAAALPPDIAICPKCEDDLYDPGSRHYLYPFTNCTNCGPRFTIARKLPYDRAATAMTPFPMCIDCLSEYENPGDRRFHAQPAACPACGPRVSLVDSAGRAVTHLPPAPDRWMEKTWELLRGGAVIAVKSLGGFHLTCNAASTEVIIKLRQSKGRPCKPLAVMCRDRAVVEKHCLLSEAEYRTLASPAAPAVLLRRRDSCRLPAALAPNLKSLGVMLPYTPLHKLLLRGPLDTLVMTSGNYSGLPLAADNLTALRELKGIADYFLLHDREIIHRCDDSVAAVVEGETQICRRSRGYIPLPVTVPGEGERAGSSGGSRFTGGSIQKRTVCRAPVVLGCGGEMKNTFCLLTGNQAVFSQHIGDLENTENLLHYRQSLAGLQRLLGVKPQIIGYDLHPHYLVSKAARDMPGTHIGVQHHHAHLASCLAENGFDGEAVGIILDGTGYGSDGRLWGFEILTGDCRSFRRRCHLAYMPLPGGEKAVRSPWVMAAACLVYFCGERGRRAARALFPDNRAHIELLCRILRGGDLTVPLSCGCGRLFDAVSALLGVCRENTYEGQAAVELEELVTESTAAEDCSGRYRFRIHGGLIEPGAMFGEIINDLEQGLPAAEIALRFHHTVAQMVVEAAALAARESGLSTAALSGGCWQNRYLFTTAKRMLQEQGFRVLHHHRVPANDGGIALGQAVIARNQYSYRR